MQVQSPGREDPLEEEMATHCNILAWEILWTEEPVGCSLWGCRESDTTEHALAGWLWLPDKPVVSVI